MMTGRIAPTVIGTVTSDDSYTSRPTSMRTGPRRLARRTMADARNQPYTQSRDKQKDARNVHGEQHKREPRARSARTGVGRWQPVTQSR